MVLEYWYLKRDIGSGKVLSKLFKCLLGLYVAGPCATIFCQTAQVLASMLSSDLADTAAQSIARHGSARAACMRR